jgi:Ca2+-binding EF-hand superfamily protein
MKAIFALAALLIIGTTAANAQAPKGPKAKMDPEAIFKKRDANSDGKMSKEEFTKGAKDTAKAEEMFTKKDKDSSGDLSLEEFKAGGKGPKGPKAAK